VGGCLENGLRHWMERNPEYEFRTALNESTKCYG